MKRSTGEDSSREAKCLGGVDACYLRPFSSEGLNCRKEEPPSLPFELQPAGDMMKDPLVTTLRIMEAIIRNSAFGSCGPNVRSSRRWKYPSGRIWHKRLIAGYRELWQKSAGGEIAYGSVRWQVHEYEIGHAMLHGEVLRYMDLSGVAIIRPRGHRSTVMLPNQTVLCHSEDDMT